MLASAFSQHQYNLEESLEIHSSLATKARARSEESTHPYMCHPLQKTRCPECHQISHTVPVVIGVEVLGAWGLLASPIVLPAGAEGDSFLRFSAPCGGRRGQPLPVAVYSA